MNPFALVFGKSPEKLIIRNPGSEEIIENFISANPHHIYMVSGIRGSGKTIVITQVAKYFRNMENWEVVDLSPDMDLLESLAAEMGALSEFRKLFQIEKMELSLPGVSIEAKTGKSSAMDRKIAVTRMLEVLKKHNRKVLVTIDEVVNNSSVRVFASVFQILLRQELPIFLIMTGLYENIHALQNEKTLTFLYRTPRIVLKPLEMAMVARSYTETFSLSREEARQMASMTKGYPFAFQILGYFTWEHNGDFGACIDQYKDYLMDYAYEKLWMEMSAKDRKIAAAIARTKTGRTQDVKGLLGISQSEYNPYRKRLIDKGIIIPSERGSVEFTLPFFEDYAIERESWEDIEG